MDSRRSMKLSPSKLALLDVLLKERQSSAAVSRPISPQAQDGVVPASFAQQRLWFLDQLFPGSPLYNIPTALSVSTALDPALLERCLNELVRRHASLRTTFVAPTGQPLQQIAPTLTLPLTVVDLSALPPDLRATTLHQHITAAARQPFDLTRGPLLRMALFQLSPSEQRLLVVLHHIVADGWSLGIFFRELTTLYAAFAADQPSPLPALPIQYADFALWQRATLQGETLARLLGYWRQQLADLPALQLPTDRPRPALPSYQGAQRQLILPAPLSAAIKTLSQQENCTLFMTLLAGWATLLHRYSGQADFAIGSPIANRTRAELEGLIGFFLNTLVLRIDLAGDPSFRTLLQRVRTVALEAYAHQELPFELLLEELRPERDLSRTPLFQVFFNLLNFADGDVQAPVLRAERSLLGETTAQFDLAVYAGEVDDRLLFQLVYSTDLFEDATIAQLLEHFEALLAGIVSNPDRHLSRLPLLQANVDAQPDQRRQQPHPTNAFVRFERAAIEQSIGARFARQVDRHPHQRAIVSGSEICTYAELAQRADAVARALRQLSCPPERVALLFSHGAAMIAGMLGVLSSGAAYVPLDTAHPLARMQAILADAQIEVILTHEPYLQRACDLAGRNQRVLDIANLPTTSDPALELPEVGPDALAYILYTSGSSGTPKGVMQNHRNVLHHIRAYTNSLHIDAEDGLTLLASYSFDAAVMDIFGALLNGATLYPIDIRNEGFDPLMAALSQQPITIYHSTPTIFRYFLTAIEDAARFTGVRLVVLGGEEALQRDVALFQQHFVRGCLLVNGLGPTESTLALQYFLDHTTTSGRASIPVGYPVEDTAISVLHPDGEPVGPYGVGEIVIHSQHVALGYWRQAEQTRRAFRSSPLGSTCRSYYTGDLGRVLPDGAVEFIGRKDLQVKIRGQRVELGEIEAQLCEHQHVAQAVVVAHAKQSGEPYLVAYLVMHPSQQSSFDSAAFQHFLRQRLPEYMLPTAYVPLTTLPLTTSGKVDRRALPAAPEPQPPTTQYIAPRSQVEATLAQLVAGLLGIERVSIHDNLFQLGMHSLLATQLVSRIRDAFTIEMPLRHMFEASTVAACAEFIEATGAGDPAQPPIVPLARERYLSHPEL